jgi:hypothetical protein
MPWSEAFFARGRLNAKQTVNSGEEKEKGTLSFPVSLYKVGAKAVLAASVRKNGQKA